MKKLALLLMIIASPALANEVCVFTESFTLAGQKIPGQMDISCTDKAILAGLMAETGGKFDTISASKYADGIKYLLDRGYKANLCSRGLQTWTFTKP